MFRFSDLRCGQRISDVTIDNSGQDDITIDFGPGLGVWVWMNNASWVKLHDLSPRAMVSGDIDGNSQDDITIDFGPGLPAYYDARLRSRALPYGFLSPPATRGRGSRRALE